MLNILWTLIIYPLFEIVEFSYRVFFALFHNPGLSIIGVSVAVTLLCLPLYIVAERWQEIERVKQLKLKPMVAHIKKSFTGDEQYMLLQTYYREEHYKPIMALRSSFGILIQIPFFIAAYQFLSHNEQLIGKAFFIIRDLGTQDGLIKIAGFSFNLLPILMTVINLISGAVYSRGHEMREKVQIILTALVFLIILYPSPAGLVFYWTCNNLFSLIKNVFYKIRHPIKKFHIIVTLILALSTCYLLLKHFKHIVAPIVLTLFVALLPLVVKAAKHFLSPLVILLQDRKKDSFNFYFLGVLSLTLLIGAVIPSLLMTTSISEYCYLDGVNNPLFFLYNSSLQSAGLFLFWGLCIYFLFGKRIKAILSFVIYAVLILSLVNCFIFQGNYGVVLPEVVFTEHRSFIPSFKEFAINSLTLLAFLVGIYLLFYYKHTKILSFIQGSILLSLVVISAMNAIKIGVFYKNYEKPSQEVSTLDKFINLSSTKKNVIVIMMDRSTGYMTDKVFEYNPELKEHFTGFTLYPNCVSFGKYTIQGALVLYGGYEYTPWQMNHRRTEAMVDKHNQGISLLANIFSHNGYTCTEMDPPYPNYDEIPVFSAFKNFPNTNCYQTLGKYNTVWAAHNGIKLVPIRSRLIKRNFVWFSLFKCAPMCLRSAIHFEEFWGPPKGSGGQDITHFIDNYSILDFLPRFTNTSNDTNCFLIMDNELCHDQVLTQLPNFTPANKIDNEEELKKYKGEARKYYTNNEFHVNNAGYNKLATYFDFLKANNCYDNSKIIIVADHGANTRMEGLFDKSTGTENFEKFNPVLMVKDFGEEGELKKDYTFMTHADVPVLALEGSPSKSGEELHNVTNPYTKNVLRPLTTTEKNTQTVISFSSANAVRSTVNNGYRIKDSDWWIMHDNIFRSSNWTHKMPETYIPVPFSKEGEEKVEEGSKNIGE